MYGDLLDQNQRSALSFSCHPNSAPELTGEPVIIQGHLQVTTSGLQPGFKVQIVGDRVGRWIPAERTPSEPFILPPERTRTPLAQLMERNPAKRLILLGTKTAITDALSQLGDADTVPATQDLSTDLATLQSAIVAAAPAHSALCLVRGGGDPGTFATFNHPELVKTLLITGIPFYVAVGHATDLTLADKYADQSFPTPTSFGSAYLTACQARDSMQGAQQRLRQAESQIATLKAERGKLYRDARQDKLDEHINTVAKAASTLSQLPEIVGRQASHAVTSSLRDLLPQLRNPFPRSRFASWPSVLFFFLLGAILGAVTFSRFETGKLADLQAQLNTIQQQTRPASPLSKVPNRKATH